jgi:cytochrome c-type biogenesis protein CcmE
MAERTWEKSPELVEKLQRGSSQRRMYFVAGLALVGVVIFLIANGAILGSSYYKTVEEVVNDPELVDKRIRVSGAVVQNAAGQNDVHFNNQDNTLTFYIAHIPNDNDGIRNGGGLATVLASAVQNEELTRLRVVFEEGDIPELMYGSEPTQAIVEGRLGADGVFYATSLQTKCPTKYEDDNPDRVLQGE